MKKQSAELPPPVPEGPTPLGLLLMVLEEPILLQSPKPTLCVPTPLGSAPPVLQGPTPLGLPHRQRSFRLRRPKPPGSRRRS